MSLSQKTAWRLGTSTFARPTCTRSSRAQWASIDDINIQLLELYIENSLIYIFQWNNDAQSLCSPTGSGPPKGGQR